nr:phage tail protein I [Saccharospirillaceae bacterium]
MGEFNSFLPPNVTALERALEKTINRTTDLPSPLRALWSTDDCPAELLPWLAWAMSLDTWSEDWPEAVKRSQIRNAVQIHRRKGTAKSVRDVVASFGAALALQEWWQKDPIGVPYSFEITLTVGAGVPATAAYQEDIIEEVLRTRPRRSQFTFIAGVSSEGAMGLGGAMRAVIYNRLRLAEAPSIGQLGWQGAARSTTYIRIRTAEG